MPKVSYTETKGLVQESGAGFDIKLGDSSAAHDLTTSIAQITGTVAFAVAQTVDVTGLIVPAGAIVIGGTVEVEVVQGNAVNIDEVGISGGDTNKYGAPTLAANALGSAVLTPTALIPAVAASQVAVATSGNATAAGRLRVTLVYIDVA